MKLTLNQLDYMMVYQKFTCASYLVTIIVELVKIPVHQSRAEKANNPLMIIIIIIHEIVPINCHSLQQTEEQPTPTITTSQ